MHSNNHGSVPLQSVVAQTSRMLNDTWCGTCKYTSGQWRCPVVINENSFRQNSLGGVTGGYNIPELLFNMLNRIAAIQDSIKLL